MCSETSPRISFSNDLVQENDRETKQVSRRDTTLLDSNSDFEFSICSNLGHESCPADDLFADGMILPVQIQERTTASKEIYRHESPRRASLPPLPCPPPNENLTKDSMRELMVVNSDQFEEKPQSKSFWRFKRSTSLNYDIKRSICSLTLLSRSNSTGSVSNSKRTTLKDTHKSNSQKQQSTAMEKSAPPPPSSSSSSSSSVSSLVYSLPQKPPLKKSGYYGKISPVLNIPPPYIYKGAANLFGLGSFLRNGKEKRIRK
ncbi:PREDICTED: uncharacterized protein LOC105113718 [Populus euphratica]|uniref:Uncharacterized protein LOC105113718 n=1 Tax=Populus euphratica TaxID=75702 RepID=A0AAJ6X7J6_POPEU|nr:PREDICTED: uncharacterized protein LOC105113718 [Populus euphratica]